jgi:maltokinase
VNADPELTTLVEDYLPRARWFGGKGRTLAVTGVLQVGELVGDEVTCVVLLAEVTYPDSSDGPEHYQVPLALYDERQQRLDHAFLGSWQGKAAYDAVHDREAMALWLRAFDEAAHRLPDGVQRDALMFHRLPGHDLDLETHSTLFSGEQSNSSVAFGEDALMKIFRKITPGVNPDIQIHQVLTEAGVEHIAPLYGWLDAVVDTGEFSAEEGAEESAGGTDGSTEESSAGRTTVQLAMLQKFLRTATDGWGLAQSSVRTLFAEPDVHAASSGGDFAGEAARLGGALADVHAALREHFPTGTRPSADLAETMQGRLEASLEAAPALGEYADALRATYDQVARLGEYPVQVVHGDLHLGQTLRTSMGWKLVDFEGEPARPLAERLEPDSPWRDVAGMLRSFDYAPRAYLHEQLGTEDESAAMRAGEWANRCRNHFVVAYAAETDERDHLLLNAFVADKAVYEVLYEARNRPNWLDIPMQAIARITEGLHA